MKEKERGAEKLAKAFPFSGAEIAGIRETRRFSSSSASKTIYPRTTIFADIESLYAEIVMVMSLHDGMRDCVSHLTKLRPWLFDNWY